MPEQFIKFIGAMDSDTPNDNFPKGFIREARNIEFLGLSDNMRPEVVEGTNLIPNSQLPVSGTNVTIGAKYDEVRKRIIFFNCNFSGHHCILIYNTLTGVFQTLVQSGINTDGDILGFTGTTRIDSIDILYGDTPVGDVLFYVDSLKRPTQIPIDIFLSSPPSPITRSMIEVAKAPPVMPPQCVYENDYSVQVNNLINGLWQFASGFFDYVSQKTVISSASKRPLPTIPYDPSKNIPVSQNARIAIYVATGDASIKKIRIYGRQTKDGATTDWLIIDDLDKAALGIADNTVYRYLFYNTGNYVAEDVAFSVLPFDIVPQQANCQALLNGNTISYAGITEGYNYPTPNISIASANTAPPNFSVNGVLFFGGPNGTTVGGQPQFTFYLTGAGDNDGLGNPIDFYWPPNILIVKALSNATDISFTYVNTLSTGIPALLAQLNAAANAKGWVVDSVDTLSIRMHYPTGTVTLIDAFVQGVAAQPGYPYNYPQLALLPQAAYQWGIKYYDAAGRTNGVITSLDGQATTPAYPGGVNIPEVTISFNYVPPSWAAYFHLVRTDNLTYNKYLDWITNAAFANTLGQKQYVYFGIGNIADYNTQLSATEGVVSYGFAAGDRIRITGRYASDATTFVSLNLDYAILGVSTNPVIDGVTQPGVFIQIAYPTADINADFKFPVPSDSNFQNYQVLIYSYKAQNPQGQNVFYEIGEEYGIVNAGTPSAFHSGNAVAINAISVCDGDVYFRPRTIPINNTYFVPTGSYTQGSPYGTVWVNPGAEGVPVVANGIWEIRGDFNKVAGLTPTTYPTAVDNNMTILNQSGSITFVVRIRWTVNVTDTTDPNGQWQMYFKIVSPSNAITILPVLDLQTGLKVGVVNTYTIDATFQMPPGYKMWLVNFAQNQMFVSGGPLQVDILRNITINVFDYSYSDIYSIKANSDNRPSISDPTARQAYFPTLFRYSEPYVPGSTINNNNRFYDANSTEYDGSFGAIRRMIAWQRRLRIAHERKWGEVGIYSKFIKNNTGQSELIVNDQIIDSNNIQYFDGNWGIGDQTSAIAVNGYQIYFYDPIRGNALRLSLDGIKDIGQEFRLKTFFSSMAPYYVTPSNTEFGATASVLCGYNYTKNRSGETYFCFQGTNTGLGSTPDQSVKFIEDRNAFSSFMGFGPDMIVSAENNLYTFFGGQLYIHNNENNRATYYGVAHPPQIRLIFNEHSAIKKNFMSMGYQAEMNKMWQALNMGDIKTSEFNLQTNLQQISKLILDNQEVMESIVYGAFLFDANSRLDPIQGWNDGDALQGTWIEILLTAMDNQYNYLSQPFIRYELLPKVP